jgi:hypothetical protein
VIAVIVIAWLAMMVTAGALLSSSQADAHHSLSQRFAARAATGAEFASLFAKGIFAQEHRQAMSLLSARQTTPQGLAAASSSVGVGAAVLLNQAGQVLQVLPAKLALIGKDITG